MRKFVFKALAFLSTDVLASAIGLFSLLILTNNMSKNSFGFFVLMLGIVVFIESLTNLQSWQGIVKFGSEDIKRVNRLYLSLNVAKAIYLDFIGSIFATLLALLTFVILFYVRNQYLTGFNVLEISLATLFFLWRFNGTATGLLRLSQDYQLINSRALLVSLLRFSSVFVILNFNQLDAIKLFFIYGCIEFIATLYFHVLVYYRMKTKVIGFKYLFVHKIKKDSFTRFCLYLADESLNHDDIFTAHDGADIEPNNSLSSEDDVNEEREFTATYIGHLYNGRGIDIIIETAKLLPNVCFEIVGGLEKDIEFWSARSPSNVIFIGHVAPVETLKYRRRSDVLLMPYQNTVSVEGGGDTSKWMSPMKLFEYMSSKKPIISSDIPVIREVLNDKNSILVDSDDVQKWVDAIKCLKKSNELRVALSEAAYYDFVNKYTWSKRAENISVFLKDRIFKKV